MGKRTNSNICRTVTDGPFFAKICQGCRLDPKKEIPYWRAQDCCRLYLLFELISGIINFYFILKIGFFKF